MSDNVVRFTGLTSLDLPAEQVLEEASNAKLQDVVIIAWDKDGDFFFASTAGKSGDVLLLLETAKHELMHASTSPTYPKKPA